MNRVGDWVYDNIGWLVVVLAVVVVASGVMASKARIEMRHRFMAQCTQHRQEYECAAMWRAGESHAEVVPIPIVVPAR